VVLNLAKPDHRLLQPFGHFGGIDAAAEKKG